jgi:large subunit ribosomal protein L35
MIKRTKKQIRQLRGTRVLFKTDGDNIEKYFLPNAWLRPAIRVPLS